MDEGTMDEGTQEARAVIIEAVQEGVEHSTEYIYSLFAGFAECITVDDEDIPEYV